MEKINKYLADIFTESLKKSLTNVLTYGLTTLFFVFSGVFLTFLSLDLNKVIVLPMYLLIILSLFALVGVIVGVEKIRKHLEYSKANISSKQKVKNVKIHCEG
jgi:hypothetical protein